ncbi:MAG: hypothetical protein J6N52_02495 [Clostridia bacterium]|nr:hypothetical protein [Clostridia bacterium]
MLKRTNILLVLVILSVAILTGCTSKEEKTAISEFKTATTKVENLNTELDTAVSEAEKLIASGEKAFDENAISTLETTVSTAKTRKATLPEQPKELEAIKSETEKLNAIDYTDILKQLSDAGTAYENSIKQLKQVTAPTEAFVIERVQATDGIDGVSAATEDNDPNGQLGKQGGYIAQVYFSYNLVNQSETSGNSIIEKGTDCGGSIEVYNTVEEAETRNTYLASFDGGIFASGSHKIVGTMIVRTSNLLTASQQKELESKLVNSLIELK